MLVVGSHCILRHSLANQIYIPYKLRFTFNSWKLCSFGYVWAFAATPYYTLNQLQSTRKSGKHPFARDVYCVTRCVQEINEKNENTTTTKTKSNNKQEIQIVRPIPFSDSQTRLRINYSAIWDPYGFFFPLLSIGMINKYIEPFLHLSIAHFGVAFISRMRNGKTIENEIYLSFLLSFQQTENGKLNLFALFPYSSYIMWIDRIKYIHIYVEHIIYTLHVHHYRRW